jgi:hypothetical protein
MGGEHGQSAALRLLHQRSKRGGRDQRNVADGDQRNAVLGQRCERHPRRVAGAARRILNRKLNIGSGHGGPYGLGAMADHDGDRARRERAHGGQDMGDERAAGQRMQHLRQRRMHALALPGGEDRDVERGGHRRVSNDTPPACIGRRRMLQSRGNRPAQ